MGIGAADWAAKEAEGKCEVSDDAIEIDKGVHLPESKLHFAKKHGSGRPSKYPWSRMEVGDSFFVKLGNISTLGSMCHTQKRYGVGTFVARERMEGDCIGVRVWRVE